MSGVISYQTFDLSCPPIPITIPVPIIEKVTQQVYDLGNSIPRELVLHELAGGIALGAAALLVRMAIPAIAGYFELGCSTTVTTALA